MIHSHVAGSGLGKDESGMKEAIKVTIKHDSHGVCYTLFVQDSFHNMSLFHELCGEHFVDIRIYSRASLIRKFSYPDSRSGNGGACPDK